MNKAIYLLCGHGGRITNGLGQELSRRGYDVVGRETVGDFKRLDFNEQVAMIAEDLKANFWHEDARVIANSYGAYLFLHAQAMMDAFIGKVMLLSPIVGEFSNEDIWVQKIGKAIHRMSLPLLTCSISQFQLLKTRDTACQNSTSLFSLIGGFSSTRTLRMQILLYTFSLFLSQSATS